MGLLDMTPSFPDYSVSHGPVTDFESLGQFCDSKLTCSVKYSGYFYFAVSEFCVVSGCTVIFVVPSSSFVVSTVLLFVLLILFSGAPFKITQVIVRRIPVFVSAFHSVRAGTDKSEQDKLVDIVSFSVFVVGKHNELITAVTLVELSLCPFSRVTGPARSVSSYFVVRKSQEIEKFELNGIAGRMSVGHSLDSLLVGVV